MKKVVALLACAMLVASMVACGTITLETFYGNAVTKAALDEECKKQLEQFDGVYSDISYEVVDNKFTYKFTFAEQLEVSEADLASTKASLEAQLDSLGPSVKAETGIKDQIEIGYVYYNPDGSVILETYKAY